MRLIDADVVYNAIKHLKEKYWHYKTATNSQFTNDCLSYIEKQLNKAPTVDAVPVVHGHWVNHHWRNANYCCYCSECHAEAMHAKFKWHEEGIYPVCPNCGAKMMDGANE